MKTIQTLTLSKTDVTKYALKNYYLVTSNHIYSFRNCQNNVSWRKFRGVYLSFLPNPNKNFVIMVPTSHFWIKLATYFELKRNLMEYIYKYVYIKNT